MWDGDVLMRCAVGPPSRDVLRKPHIMLRCKAPCYGRENITVSRALRFYTLQSAMRNRFVILHAVIMLRRSASKPATDRSIIEKDRLP